MRQVIRADLDLLADRPPDPLERVPAPPAKRARAKPNPGENPGTASLSAAGAGPGLGAGERKGRAGRSAVRRRRRPRSARRLSCARDPPAAGALRARLALQSAAASAKILRLNADEGALRDLRFAVGDPLGPAAKLLALWRDLAGRPPSLDPGRILDAAARLDLAVDPNGLASSLKACAGEGDPVSAAAKAAALAFSAFPDAPAAEAEILALWVFDMVIAIRLRWPRPVPLIATKILDPSLRSPGAADGQGRATQPGQTPPQARSRSPPPPPSTSPPISARRSEHSDRRRAQTALETGPENRRPHARRRIASRPPKRPATRR